MIQINNLVKSYGSFTAVDNVSINVPKGTIHGLIGENGAGKTTIIHCATGVYKPTKGEVLIDGKNVYDNPFVKAKIGYVADSCNYFPSYTVNNMVNFYKGIYETFDEDKFNRLNEIFALPTDRRINQLSKGMTMRLALMLNISYNPDVLILDEPTSGLDAIAKKQVMDILIDEVEERKCSVMISSHHLSELEKLCDNVTIINNGKVKYQSSISDIKNKIRKLQTVFKNDIDLSQIKGIIHIENIGSIKHIITDNYSDEFEKMLYDMGAVIVEEIGMSLEEIFIYTSENREV